MARKIPEITYRYGGRYNVHTNNKTDETEIVSIERWGKRLPCIAKGKVIRKNRKKYILINGFEFALSDVLAKKIEIPIEVFRQDL